MKKVLVFCTVGLLFLQVNTIAVAKSFQCLNVIDGFQKSIGEWGDECIKYVRYETDIEYGCCNGNAETCYADAVACGYFTGDEPVVGAIMVMGAWSGGSSIGHDAIVIEIDQDDSDLVKVRDSNWDLDHKIQEHWIDTGSGSYSWFKYIYCENSNQTSTGYRFISDQGVSIAWSPANVPILFDKIYDILYNNTLK